MMFRTSLQSILFAGSIALPAHADSATVSAVFDASLTIADACMIDTDGGSAQVACRNASAWRVDGATVTF